MEQGIFERHMQMMHEREQMLAEQGIKIFRLSTTERQEFKECRRRWDFSSLSRQALEPNRPAMALWFGTGIHHVLEHLYMRRKAEAEPGMGDLVGSSEEEFVVDLWNDWTENEIAKMEKLNGPLWDEQKEALRDSGTLGREMLQHYVRWSSVADYVEPNGFKQILYTEKEFAVWVPGPDGEPYHFTDGSGQVWEIWLVGRLDLFVEDFDGRIWVVDHKTSKDKLDTEILTLDDQMTMYIWAAQRILQKEIAGCLYNVLRKKLPVVPRVLASGKGLSKDKSIDTTYDVYLQAILDNGFDPKDYEDILHMLKNKDAGFFTRAKVYRNQHEIAMAGRMLLMEAIDMLNDPYIYPSPTWDCRWKCDFKDLCLTMNRNDDVDYLLKTLYRPRQVEEGSEYAREHTNG